MVLPVAAAGAFFPGALSSKRSRILVRVLCALAVFTAYAAIILSSSRAGLGGALVGLIFLYCFLCALPIDKRPALMDRVGSRAVAVALMCGLLLLAIAFVGPAGRNQVDVRLNETVTSNAD